MSSNVKAIPNGYHTITPSLVVREAAKAIDFYKKAFAAEEKMRMPGPTGIEGFAIVSDENWGRPCRSRQDLKTRSGVRRQVPELMVVVPPTPRPLGMKIAALPSDSCSAAS